MLYYWEGSGLSVGLGGAGVRAGTTAVTLAARRPQRTDAAALRLARRRHF